MILRFIGKDGSMGLRNGKVYAVIIESHRFDNNIWVKIPEIRDWKWPYASPQSFAKNWCKV